LTPSLTIVCQTHSGTDNQKLLGMVEPSRTRYPGFSKAEISAACVKSLMISAAKFKNKYPHVPIRVHIIDDRSHRSVIDNFKHSMRIAESAGVETSLAPLDGEGLLHSCRRTYEYGRDHASDLVYFVQDDYLHYPSAITLMAEHWSWASRVVGNDISISPFNDPHFYTLENSQLKTNLVMGSDRLWRTGIQVSFGFMTHHRVVTKNWDLFDAFWQHPVDATMEQDTISRLFWERNYVLMIPIPSLALHLQYESERDPILDWRNLWNHVTRGQPLSPQMLAASV
jgi:hypothetical protein